MPDETDLPIPAFLEKPTEGWLAPKAKRRGDQIFTVPAVSLAECNRRVEAERDRPLCRYCANPADGNEGLDDIDGALSHEACRTGHYQSALWKAEAAVARYEYDTAFEAAYENAHADREAFLALLRDVQIYHGGEGCHECSLGLGHGETAVLPGSGTGGL